MTDLADELRKLDELQQTGLLTKEEFAAAKARLLAGPTTSVEFTSLLQDQLAELKHQAELARIDREWDIERRQYQITSRSGSSYIPSASSSLFNGLVGGFFGAFIAGVAYTVQNITTHFGYETPTISTCEAIAFWFGVALAAAAIVSGIYRCLLAQNYRSAHDAYQTRRLNASVSPIPTSAAK
jgi:hypothetical protein